MPFRLAALRAGLELDADTSPPVLRRVPCFHSADKITQRYDVVRAYLRLLGPATPKHVLLDGAIAGTWRPRETGKHFRVLVELWTTTSGSARRPSGEQAERLAASQQVPLSGIDLDGVPT